MKNTGSVAGTEVVQMYLRNTDASVEQPVRELKGFARVELAPGESKHVELPLGFDELNFYNVEVERTVEPTTYKVWVAGVRWRPKRRACRSWNEGSDQRCVLCAALNRQAALAA